MITHHIKRLMSALLLAACAAAPHALATEFTYHGQLKENGIPVSGLYDFYFELFDAASDGTSLGTVVRIGLPVTGGMFSVSLDFGPDRFDGAERWLQTGARLSAGGSFVLMEPRTRVTPVPHAMFARNIAGGAPLGVVIDWWRADPGTPVPPGYQVCDGSIVSDPESPLHGAILPDLRGKFVMGSTDGATVGESGGSTSHAHSVDINHKHPNQSTSSAGSHTHDVNVPAFTEALRTTAPAGGHQHTWLVFGALQYSSWTFSGAPGIMINWTNGIDSAGSGYLPVADQTGTSGREWHTDATVDHQHGYTPNHDHPSFSSGAAPAHTHSLDLEETGALHKPTLPASNLPPYYGLLKVMRIK